MVNKKFNFIILGIILFIFFIPLPIPVENMEGAMDKNNFIYGGVYYTSIYEQVNYGNYIPLSILIIPSLGFIRNYKRRDD